jgi:hypothetical protein
MISTAASLSLAFASLAGARTFDSLAAAFPSGVPAELHAAIRADNAAKEGSFAADTTPWTEQIVTEDDGVADDRFSTAVAVSGDTAVIASAVWSYNAAGAVRAANGKSGASVNANQRGAIYIFTRQDGVWTQTQKLFASDAAEYSNFGSALALEGDNLLVASLNANVGDVSQEGAVYAFTRSGDTWTQTQKISSSDGASADAFGSAVALHGTTAVIGALDGHPNGNTMQGKAYVFTLADGIWTEQQILVADDGASNDRFGQSLAFDGTTILIGAPTLPYNFNHAGWVYAFEQSGGSWAQTAKIIPQDTAVGDQFGYAIGVAGDTALISSIGNQFAHGAVYVFAHSGDAWTQMQKFSPDDSASGDQFGNALAMQDGTAIVGAQAMVAGEQKGTAYVVQASGGVWGTPMKLVEGGAGSLDLFGSAVAYDGTTALVGAPGATVDERNSQGYAHFYAAPPPERIFCSGFEGGADATCN